MLVTEEISNFNYINYIEDMRPKFIKKIKILDILKDIYFTNKLKRLIDVEIEKYHQNVGNGNKNTG